MKINNKMKHLQTYKIFELNKELRVTSLDGLEQLLKEYNIPLEKWGTDGFKTLEHLWGELEEEECILRDVNGVLTREVDFVGARIIYKKGNKKYRLWEDRAIFKDGRVRIRQIQHSMAEKFKSGEDPTLALIRGMKEELSIELNKNQFAFYNKERIENNEDFPGILSYHNGYYYLISLTDEQFDKNGYIEKQKDKDIYFVWRKVGSRIKGHFPLPFDSDKVIFEKYKNKL